jgi:hypothetical protein
MLAIWGWCYTEVFREPPCSPWSEFVIDGLFFLNFVSVAFFPFRSRQHAARLLLSFLIAGAELTVTALIWCFAGMSVSGFYF